MAAPQHAAYTPPRRPCRHAAGRDQHPHQAGHQEGQAALLPLQHQLELRPAAPGRPATGPGRAPSPTCRCTALRAPPAAAWWSPRDGQPLPAHRRPAPAPLALCCRPGRTPPTRTPSATLRWVPNAAARSILCMFAGLRIAVPLLRLPCTLCPCLQRVHALHGAAAWAGWCHLPAEPHAGNSGTRPNEINAFHTHTLV